ncbi:MAG: YlxR family protein [Leifsonia sp.]|nr:YlxR family protein [Leifsonia sp.]
MNPVRTCLGCRERADTSALLRVVASGGEIVPDPSATLPGRGAWVHPTSRCVDSAVKRRAFGRALRVAEALDTGRLYASVASNKSVL